MGYAFLLPTLAPCPLSSPSGVQWLGAGTGRKTYLQMPLIPGQAQLGPCSAVQGRHGSEAPLALPCACSSQWQCQWCTGSPLQHLLQASKKHLQGGADRGQVLEGKTCVLPLLSPAESSYSQSCSPQLQQGKSGSGAHLLCTDHPVAMVKGGLVYTTTHTPNTPMCRFCNLGFFSHYKILSNVSNACNISIDGCT